VNISMELRASADASLAFKARALFPAFVLSVRGIGFANALRAPRAPVLAARTSAVGTGAVGLCDMLPLSNSSLARVGSVALT
jgi:hypothetical protein